jgi:hypothetical protein
MERLKARIQRFVEEYHKKYNINTEEAKKRADKERERERNSTNTESDQSVNKETK